MNIRTSSIAAAVGAIVISLGAGCSVFDSGGSKPKRDDRVTVEGLSRANIVKEGRGTLSYKAPTDGTLYVMNAENDDVVLQQRIRRGQTVEVSPDENRIRIDNETVSKTDLKRDGAHKIYLVRDRDADRSSDRNSGSVRGVPENSELIGSGRNEEISFKARRDGVVYVYDADDGRVVSRQTIRDGERFVLSPGLSRATIDGHSIDDNSFDTKSNYRVYFNRGD